MKLKNTRHEAFAAAIADGKSGTDAYVSSGYSVSRNVAAACASRLLKKAQIRRRIDQLRDVAETRMDVTLEKTMRGLAVSAFANVLDYFRIDEAGHPIPNLSAVTRREAARIADVRVETYNEGRGKYARPVQRTIIRSPDKTKALRKLAELLIGPTSPRCRTRRGGRSK